MHCKFPSAYIVPQISREETKRRQAVTVVGRDLATCLFIICQILLFCLAIEGVDLLPVGVTAYCFLLRYDITFS